MGDFSQIPRLLDAVRERAPLVHNLTNNVVQNDSASAIAAVGATQATVHNVEEARELAAISSAVSINLGTPDALWTEGARIAADVAVEMNKPWVLDPVAVGLLPYRTELAAEFLARGPSVVKANASETLAIAGVDARTHGADSQHDPDEALDAAVGLAARASTVVACTGAVDIVTDGRRVVRIANGHPMMGRLIGTGCMLSPLVAAFLAVAEDPLDGAVAGLGVMAVAGEIAAAAAAGPGSLRALLFDALHNLDGETLSARLNLQPRAA